VPDRDDAVVCDEEPINELLVVLKAGGTEGASVTRARFLWEPLAVRLAGTRECADADLVACVACARAGDHPLQGDDVEGPRWHWVISTRRRI
jgi:hypothetical protein